MALRSLIGVPSDTSFPFGHCCYIKIYNIKWYYYSFFFTKIKHPLLYTGAYWNVVELTVFFRTDGSFVVHDVPSGSYVVEVISPAYKFEPVRVDITSKGKMRWAFPDLLLYWSIKHVWQHSRRGNVNIISRRTFLKIQSLISFILLYLWP